VPSQIKFFIVNQPRTFTNAAPYDVVRFECSLPVVANRDLHAELFGRRAEFTQQGAIWYSETVVDAFDPIGSINAFIVVNDEFGQPIRARATFLTLCTLL